MKTIVNSTTGKVLFAAEEFDLKKDEVAVNGLCDLEYDPKVYTALLTQSGTSAPTAIVLENTLGVSVTFGYTIAGQYSVTATGALTINKTWIIFNNIDSNGFTITYNGKSLNDFQILTRNGGLTTDNILNLTEIEIRVYN